MAEKNRIYKIYELRDEMRKALNNLDFVEGQEKLLLSILSTNIHAPEFEEFIKATKTNWAEYDMQRANLNTRIEKCNKLIALYEKKDETSKIVSEVISLVLVGMGLDDPEKPKKN